LRAGAALSEFTPEWRRSVAAPSLPTSLVPFDASGEPDQPVVAAALRIDISKEFSTARRLRQRSSNARFAFP